MNEPTRRESEKTMAKVDPRVTMEGQKDALAVTRIKSAASTLADDAEHLRSTIVRLENALDDAEQESKSALEKAGLVYTAKLDKLQTENGAALAARDAIISALRTEIAVMRTDRDRLEKMRQAVLGEMR